MRATFLVNRSVHTYIHFDLTVRSIVHIVVEKRETEVKDDRNANDGDQVRLK